MSVISRENGVYYTDEKTIFYVIKPLFLDSLLQEFASLRDNKDALQIFHEKLATLIFFDPACGEGDFLLAIYLALQALEGEIVKITGGPQRVSPEQFYGIDIDERALSTCIQTFNEATYTYYGHEKGSPHLIADNALRVDWSVFLDPRMCSYIIGNPPFRGGYLKSPMQKEDMVIVFHGIKARGLLDYCAAWFLRTAQYMQYNPSIEAAFIANSSIIQGVQNAILWRPLLEHYGVKINFAYKPFPWQGRISPAHVNVIIIGFATFDRDIKIIFEHMQSFQVTHINSYLLDMPQVYIPIRSTPLCSVPIMRWGNKQINGKKFIMMDDEKRAFLQKEPKAEPFIKPFINTKEYLYGQKKWVLWLKDADPTEYSKLPLVMERIQKVKEVRAQSKKHSTRKYPHHHLFQSIRQPSSNYLLVPCETSEKRGYIPMSFFTKEDIISNLCQPIPDATLYHFGILQSKMHMIWINIVCGRRKGCYLYSAKIVYNNFPWPEAVSEKQQQQIEAAAQNILEARAVWPHSTLAELYNPLTMPENLLHAHQHLDTLVDSAYREQPFHSEMERIQFLFALYQGYKNQGLLEAA